MFQVKLLKYCEDWLFTEITNEHIIWITKLPNNHGIIIIFKVSKNTFCYNYTLFLKKNRRKQNANTFNISENRILVYQSSKSSVVFTVQNTSGTLLSGGCAYICHDFLSVCYDSDLKWYPLNVLLRREISQKEPCQDCTAMWKARGYFFEWETLSPTKRCEPRRCLSGRSSCWRSLVELW